MKTIITFPLLLRLLFLTPNPARAQESKSVITSSNTENQQQVLIDKITVPAQALEIFTEKMNSNRRFIQQLPGFVRDEVYMRAEENGDLVYLTVAIWENAELFKKAKEAVETEYKRLRFNPREFCQQRGIKMERAIYQPQ